MDFLSKYLANGMTLMVVTLLVLAIAYRYYSAFLAAKVLALDPNRPTPAHALNDGQNYYPTNKWVLFGHHFAAIAGAGPLIGPVLAATIWLSAGLFVDTHWRLSGRARCRILPFWFFFHPQAGASPWRSWLFEAGPVAGSGSHHWHIIFVLVIALAGLGKVVTKRPRGRAWSNIPPARSLSRPMIRPLSAISTARRLPIACPWGQNHLSFRQ